MNLQEQGFRFVYQDGLWSWTHPTRIKADAIDGTDLDDEAFEATVLALTQDRSDNR